MYKVWYIAGAVLLLFGGCVGYTELPEPVKILRGIPADARSIAIHVLPATPGSVRNLETSADLSITLARSIREALARRKPDWRIEIREGQTPPVKTDLALRSEFLEVDGGSTGMRFWIGFNAGATQSIVQVSILDGAGQELAASRISHSTMCPTGLCTDSNEKMLQRNFEGLADEIAQFVIDPTEYAKRK